MAGFYKTFGWILSTFGGADASAASTWFRSFVFEFWDLRFRVLGASFSRLGCFVFDLGCFVFEFWVLRFRDWVLRFWDLGASCFGLRFRMLRFWNYPQNDRVRVRVWARIWSLGDNLSPWLKFWGTFVLLGGQAN